MLDVVRWLRTLRAMMRLGKRPRRVAWAKAFGGEPHEEFARVGPYTVRVFSSLDGEQWTYCISEGEPRHGFPSKKAAQDAAIEELV